MESKALYQKIGILLLAFVSLQLGTQSLHGALWPRASQPMVRYGIDCLIEALKKEDPSHPYVNLLSNKRVGLVTNQTGKTAEGDLTLKALEPFLKIHGSHLAAIFALEHGVYGTLEASQPVVEDSEDGSTLRVAPVCFSLYGSSDESLYPTISMLDAVDLIIYDIADVGTRCYTYASSLFYLLKSIGAYHNQHPERTAPLTIMVLDRPNPINGLVVDGPGVEENWQSFIGVFDVPVCHGMTIGELAWMYNQTVNPFPAPLKIIPIQGWQRADSVDLKTVSWTPSSPNMPTIDTTRLYPITVIGEGLTFLNAGKGTPQPFQYLVAPALDGLLWAQAANQLLLECSLQGVRISDYTVEPSAGPYMGIVCQGVRIEVLDTLAYKPVAVQYILLEALQKTHPAFLKAHLQELYDRRHHASRIHIGKPLSNYYQACWLIGSNQLLEALASGKFCAKEFIEAYAHSNKQFLEKRKPYLLYF